MESLNPKLIEALEEYNTSALKDHETFLIELVKLTHSAIEEEVSEKSLTINSLKLLDYVCRCEDGRLILLLTETLWKIQRHRKIKLINAESSLELLCDLFFIQTGPSDSKIYLNILKLINDSTHILERKELKAILDSKLTRIDANVYECFNLPLSLELLHFYLKYDLNSFRTLYIDMLTDWELFSRQLNEKGFEKLLWYGFALEEIQTLKETVNDYEFLIKSDNWIIKFYRFIIHNLAQEKPLDVAKIQRAVKKFNTFKTYSASEKEFIANTINQKVKNKELELKRSLLHKTTEKKNILNSLTRLSPYNLPDGVELKDVNQEKLVHVAVFENDKMDRILKVIYVKGLIAKNCKTVFTNKATITKIKEEALPGYIHIIHEKNVGKLKAKQKESGLFKWPSTDITGKGLNDENNIQKLRKQSFLREMGYQITATSRDKRWSILQRAVPSFGLKRVAYAIASNVRLRKGQKNGVRKFSYAISEWEHDLSRLKSKYYKKDFNWPKT